MQHPRMTYNGRRWAFVIGVVLALSLPKKVDCGFPSGVCERAGTRSRERCTDYEIEPFGFYLLELALGRDVGFAYSSDQDCR